MSETRVVITAFGRPEMLWHCLSRIDKADKPDNLRITFRLDHGYDREIHDVLGMFGHLPADVSIAPKHPFHGSTKQSANVLGGLYQACRLTDPDTVVHLVEDDVMVGPDHFTFSDKAHRSGEFFCVITSGNCNGGEEKEEPAIGLKISTGTYRGIGTSFRAGAFLDHIAPHIRPDYYLNPRQYIRKTFVPDPFGGSWTEQDGLIRRIQMQEGMPPIAYAITPKSFHAGYYGKNRNGRRPTGTLAQRIDKLGAVIYSDDAMRKENRRAAYYEDSKPLTFDR